MHATSEKNPNNRDFLICTMLETLMGTLSHVKCVITRFPSLNSFHEKAGRSQDSFCFSYL
jgi:hypothetical protein